MEQIEFLKLAAGVQLPTRATEQSAGLDLCAFLQTPLTLHQGDRALVPTGLAMALPKYTVGYIYARSSLGAKHGITLPNGVGVIDADYRGELKVALINLSATPYTIHNGDRVAQLVIAPVFLPTPVEVTSLEDTQRGSGGFGSSGK